MQNGSEQILMIIHDIIGNTNVTYILRKLDGNKISKLNYESYSDFQKTLREVTKQLNGIKKEALSEIIPTLVINDMNQFEIDLIKGVLTEDDVVKAIDLVIKSIANMCVDAISQCDRHVNYSGNSLRMAVIQLHVFKFIKEIFNNYNIRVCNKRETARTEENYYITLDMYYRDKLDKAFISYCNKNKMYKYTYKGNNTILTFIGLDTEWEDIAYSKIIGVDNKNSIYNVKIALILTLKKLYKTSFMDVRDFYIKDAYEPSGVEIGTYIIGLDTRENISSHERLRVKRIYFGINTDSNIIKAKNLTDSIKENIDSIIAESISILRNMNYTLEPISINESKKITGIKAD